MMKAMIELLKKTGHAAIRWRTWRTTAASRSLPGETATLVWTFARRRDLQFACDIPGHYEDGMHGAIRLRK